MKYQVTLLKTDGGQKDGGVIDIPGKKSLTDKQLLEHLEKKKADYDYRRANGRIFFGNASVLEEHFKRLEFNPVEEEEKE